MGCVLYAGVVFRATIASALSVRHLQSIILKIVINYIVFAQARRVQHLQEQSPQAH